MSDGVLLREREFQGCEVVTTCGSSQCALQLDSTVRRSTVFILAQNERHMNQNLIRDK
jgi:hypothetical protein